MKLTDLFPQDQVLAQQLAEVSLKQGLRRAGMAGALAANLGVAGIGAYSMRNAPTLNTPTAASSQSVGVGKSMPSAAATVAKPTADQTRPLARPDTVGTPSTLAPRSSIRPQTRPNDPAADSSVHPNYPDELLGMDTADPDVRVAAFVKFITPHVRAENRKLYAAHVRLARDLYYLTHSRPISRAERAWIAELGERYGTTDLEELTQRVDVIPPSMAIAQAALESGWGQDYTAKQGNAFYGQKSWSKTGGVEGPEGERYRGFDTPADSVNAYMHNLNTHNAYEDFRQRRAELRAADTALTGAELVPTLLKYSTRGKEYPRHLLQVMRSRDLNALDDELK